MADEHVSDEEILYRSVWLQDAYYAFDDDGNLRLSSAAFDKAFEISLYRHNLCDDPPTGNPPRLRPTDVVVQLQASKIRQCKIAFGNSGEVINLDVRPDLAEDQHPAHAVIFPDRNIGNSVFRTVRKCLAEIVDPNWPITPPQAFVDSLRTKRPV